MPYSDHSKVSYIDYDEIQNRINIGELNAFDIIYTKDTHENIIISPDLLPISIKSKVYRFLDVESAERALNESTDTYSGQLVSIVYQGKYVGYIVNQRNTGEFYVSPLNTYEGQIDYDTLGNKPIINLTGTLSDTVIISEMETGIYKIRGQYKITGTDETIYLSANSNLFLVEHHDDTVSIKKITAQDIIDYTVNSDGELISSVVPTTKWLMEQGYVTEGYVDEKIAALNFITKEEVSQYVSDLVIQTIGDNLDEIIEKKIDEKFSPVSAEEIKYMF